MEILKFGIQQSNEMEFALVEVYFALVENGVIHTDNLPLEEADEMKERYQYCFPNNTWEVLPMNAVIRIHKLKRG
jgi:hypothetical protein